MRAAFIARMLGIAVGVLFLALPANAAPAMQFPGREWQTATPQSQGLDPARLADAVAYLKARTGRDGVNELVIVRNGSIVWAGDRATKVHGVWSAAKSFTSTCLGLLIDDGRVRWQTRASDSVPALRERYPGVTLRHFATMTSGYRAMGDATTGSYTHGPSPTPFQPGEPLFAPGSAYAYWDSAMNVFALALTRIAGEPLDDLFRRRVAGPIGMDPRGWRWGTFDTIDGVRVNIGAGNLRQMEISAREMARMGHLFLNEGVWNGKRILSAEWVRAATAVQAPAALRNAWPQSAIEGPGCYGYNWWRNGCGPDGQPMWPGAPPEAYGASGHNNNKLIVIPPWRMVVVRLGLDQADGKLPGEVIGEFLKRLGAAITE